MTVCRMMLAVVLCSVLVGVEGKKKLLKSKTKTKTGGGDDDMCWDSESQRHVYSGDCPHNCCVGNDCGSDSECKAAMIVGLAIVGAVLCCCCVVIVVLFAFIKKKACFSESEKAPPSPIHQQSYPQQDYPQQGYPQNPQDNLYPPESTYAYSDQSPPYDQGMYGQHPPPQHQPSQQPPNYY